MNNNPYSMPPSYDAWRTASPPDEDDTRQTKLRLEPREPREWESRVVNGRRIYEEDFIA